MNNATAWQLLDKVGMLIYADKNLNIKDVNHAFIEYAQISKPELTGISLIEFFSVYNDEKIVDEFLANLSENKIASATIKLKIREIVRWVSIHGEMQTTPQGEINFIIALVPADAEKKLQSIDENDLLKAYKRDLKIAQGYIKNILPDPKLFKRINPNAFLIYVPMRGIGGDWYWFHVEKERTLFLMGDVMGHGINAGIISTIIASKLSVFKDWSYLTEPKELLHIIHKNLKPLLRYNSQEENIHKDFSIDVIGAIYYPQTRVFSYSSANFPLLIQRDKNFLDIEIQKQGIYPAKPWASHHFSNHSILLEPNDFVWVFSDGVKDQFDDVTQKPMGTKRFKELLLQATHQYQDMSEIENFLLSKVAEWMGTAEQTDDIMLGGVKIV